MLAATNSMSFQLGARAGTGHETGDAQGHEPPPVPKRRMGQDTEAGYQLASLVSLAVEAVSTRSELFKYWGKGHLEG